jgi:hypothetical protein
MLTQDETVIIDYLKPLGKQFISAKEVCRRAAGKQRFNKDQDWAKPLLKRLEKKGVLESNALGHYRIKPEEDDKRKIPLAPHIQRILAQSSQDFSETAIIQLDDDYEKLSKDAPAKPGSKKPKS